MRDGVKTVSTHTRDSVAASRCRTVHAVLLVLMSCFVAMSGAAESAATLNQRAMHVAMQGDLPTALPLFQSARKREPRNVEYIINEGVTLMRLGKYDEVRTSGLRSGQCARSCVGADALRTRGCRAATAPGGRVLLRGPLA